MTITRAPRSDSFRMVGRLARIRPSSVIRGLSGSERSSGTLRSARSSTRRPATARSSMVFISFVFSLGAARCAARTAGRR